jgi:hypothetical protein
MTKEDAKAIVEAMVEKKDIEAPDKTDDNE